MGSAIDGGIAGECTQESDTGDGDIERESEHVSRRRRFVANGSGVSIDGILRSWWLDSRFFMLAVVLICGCGTHECEEAKTEMERTQVVGIGIGLEPSRTKGRSRSDEVENESRR